ncbi:MAG: HAD family hydrolase [Candidatus Micrarchaeia archaeon]
MKNKALFLDRDGTIIEHVPYISDPAKVGLVMPVIRKMLEFQRKNYLVIIITNQSGIARGFITQEEYDAVNTKMLKLLEIAGVRITGIFMCPSHPDEKDPRRKPNPGMILEAAEKFNIDLPESIMVGDSENDLEAGKRAGVKISLPVAKFLNFSL